MKVDEQAHHDDDDDDIPLDEKNVSEKYEEKMHSQPITVVLGNVQNNSIQEIILRGLKSKDNNND